MKSFLELLEAAAMDIAAASKAPTLVFLLCICRFMDPKKKGERRGSQNGEGRRGSLEANAAPRRGSITKIQIGGRKE